MKQLIELLRYLEAAWEKYEKPEPGEPFPYADQIAEALPQLLDRLEKLEVVVETAEQVAAIANEALTSQKADDWYSALDDISYLLDSGCGAFAALEDK